MESRSMSPQLEFKHRSFSPISIGWGQSTPLQYLCTTLEEHGWELVNIVPHHDYESIAVFQRITKLSMPTYVAPGEQPD